MNNIVITVGREFGSGGREVAKKVAEKMNFNYYDKELLELASQESGFSKELFEDTDEKRKFVFSDGFFNGTNVMIGGFYNFQDTPSSENLFLLKSEVIKKLAQTENCVIVGRCADYVLKSFSNVLRIFIHNKDMDKKIARIRDRHPEVVEKNLQNFIKKTDKNRANYYNYYTDQEWGNAKYYDLTIDTSFFGVEDSVDVICEAIKTKFKNDKI